MATALLSGLTVVLCAGLWRAIGGAPMTIHGWIALSIAVSGTALLTVGLTTLAFHSHRSGHDARVGDGEDAYERIRRRRGPRR